MAKVTPSNTGTAGVNPPMASQPQSAAQLYDAASAAFKQGSKLTKICMIIGAVEIVIGVLRVFVAMWLLFGDRRSSATITISNLPSKSDLGGLVYQYGFIHGAGTKCGEKYCVFSMKALEWFAFLLLLSHIAANALLILGTLKKNSTFCLVYIVSAMVNMIMYDFTCIFIYGSVFATMMNILEVAAVTVVVLFIKDIGNK